MVIKNIVFSGGGLKGWAYIGTLKALYELIDFKNIEQIIGVSIGSVFGLFYLLQIPYDFILDIIMNLNFKELIDIDIDNILVNQSLINGNNYIEKIKEIISTKIDPDITFIELYHYNKILYTTNALNINNSKIEYFNYKLTPNVKIVDAIMASSSLPLLFPPYKINEKYYYDGGLCNNCPVNLIDELESIAFDISHVDSENNNNIKLFDLMMSFISISNKINTINENNLVFQILDSRFKNEVMNINQTRDDIFNIYMNGYINSKNSIFDNFIALKN
jgi:predicted acylesterase/phospholipase RssA